ncbi:cyclodeaminase/cyclohydrolase family protein [Clostridium frigidicarnis]|uniref:Formiminotetrahydrofolate cyclodeaminase n=1 Tax=Clostridium frigidicarnis TaxID=84698 RepID=A0A1I0WIX6_9CLOT|nr:cyclodeaminase/cyclohydrolase family protein [Clostridium frigidicarnis]SFA88571.1 Formiminotetrahydrofolate cyclodeaminase [Clostridium frigidicarnis]
MLSDLTIKGFVGELSSNSPAPGGGSVAALGASIGAALGSMVFSLTIGKKVYNNYDEETKKLIDGKLVKANDLKNKYLQLMEDDTEAFLKVMEAFKMPKETEEEKKARKEKIDESYKGALDVPYNLANLCYEAYDVIEVAVKYGNINAVSDAGVAALFIQASLESAILNVKINLSSVSDEEKKKVLKERCNELISTGRNRRDDIIKIADEKIEG